MMNQRSRSVVDRSKHAVTSSCELGSDLSNGNDLDRYQELKDLANEPHDDCGRYSDFINRPRDPAACRDLLGFVRRDHRSRRDSCQTARLRLVASTRLAGHPRCAGCDRGIVSTQLGCGSTAQRYRSRDTRALLALQTSFVLRVLLDDGRL